MVHPGSILGVLALSVLHTLSSAGSRTPDQCNGDPDFDNKDNKVCTMGAGSYRSIANRVSPGSSIVDKFSGDVDVYASDDGATFATNIHCSVGQAWPRISEGLVVPEHRHPRYEPPRTVLEYLEVPGGRFISYNGYWIPRNFPTPGGEPSGGRQNGAYIWLNSDDKFDSAGNPVFPFSTEINIWIKHVGGPPPQATKISDRYYDGDDVYNVSYWPDHPDNFTAIYLHEIDGSKTHLVVNIKEVFRFLLDRNLIDGNHRLITVDVAAEGICPTDGKFVAEIATMGHP